ncbi:hypothetical protein [Methylobacter marinus]|uniref:hypothetical protein n=1 Tax=Methylobacter marinus TaxID=34058 RepID=UPI0003797A4F|nr:hypothetical protein [Methylobacter marinus]
MLDRITNLLTLFGSVAALLILVISLYHAWDVTASWEKEWVVKEGAQPSHTAETLQKAMHNANAASDYEAVRKLKSALEADYEPSGKVLVRFSTSELAETAIAFFAMLLFLIIPLSINYVRHSAFRFWNRGT